MCNFCGRKQSVRDNTAFTRTKVQHSSICQHISLKIISLSLPVILDFDLQLLLEELDQMKRGKKEETPLNSSILVESIALVASPSKHRKTYGTGFQDKHSQYSMRTIRFTERTYERTVKIAKYFSNLPQRTYSSEVHRPAEDFCRQRMHFELLLSWLKK